MSILGNVLILCKAMHYLKADFYSHRLMYWSEVGEEPQIEKAGMDGSSRKILIDQGLGRPTSIALDQLSWKIFWSDDKFHSIGSANLDGTGIRVSVLLTGGLFKMSHVWCRTHSRKLTFTTLDVAANTNQEPVFSHCFWRWSLLVWDENENNTACAEDDRQEPGCPHQALWAALWTQGAQCAL